MYKTIIALVVIISHGVMDTVSSAKIFAQKPAQNLSRFHYSQIHMGVRVDITLYAESEEQAINAAKSAFVRFDELDAIMSDYRVDSELNKFCSSGYKNFIELSPDLFTVLNFAQTLAAETNGAFDITCGSLIKLWREAQNKNSLPTKEQIKTAKKTAGYQNLILDGNSKSAKLKTPNILLDLGGIAKGYACEQAIQELKKHNIKSAMIQAGGDIVVSNPPPKEKGWKVSIFGSNSQHLILDNCAISTSGDAEQFVEINGKRYSHILDPRTGIGLTSRIQVTVISQNGMISDALATTLCIMGEQDSNLLLTKYDAKAIFTQMEKEKK